MLEEEEEEEELETPSQAPGFPAATPLSPSQNPAADSETQSHPHDT